MSLALRQEAIDAGLIDTDHHDQLLADLSAVCRQAGIPESYVWLPLRDFCGEQEVGYISQLKRDDCELGMVYIGKVDGKPVNERMMAIAGACLRNYINAKVMTVYDIVERLKTGDMPSPSVLLIPDFCDGNATQDWKKSGLLGMLYKREQEGKKTVLHIESKKALEAQYGPSFAEHLKKFVHIKNNT